MRTSLLTSAVAVTALLVGALPVLAQGNPSADQIIRALSPTGAVQSRTRGIRPAAPAAAVEAPTETPSVAGVTQAGAPQAVGARRAAAPAAAPATPPPAAAAQAAPSVDLTVQFLTGSADLTPEAMRTLDQLGRALSSEALAAFRFRIEGHTDTTGSRELNMTLSQERATRVAEYLKSRFGVAGSRLEPVGRGQEALRVNTPDQTPEARNRRVQVVNIGA